MKRFLTLALMVSAVFCSLHGCGCDNGEDADLVFVNDSNGVIVAVVADFENQNSGTQHADSSPMKRGESFGFEAGVYPVTVTAYDRPIENYGQKELGSVTIHEAPPEGERWYVTAKSSGIGLAFTVDTRWPEGV